MALDQYNISFSKFGTSWISDYGSENEFLFAGNTGKLTPIGGYGLKLQTVIIQESSTNFKTFFSPFFAFDTMLRGNSMDDSLIDMLTVENMNILINLIKIQVKMIPNNNEYPRYIIDIHLIPSL